MTRDAIADGDVSALLGQAAALEKKPTSASSPSASSLNNSGLDADAAAVDSSPPKQQHTFDYPGRAPHVTSADAAVAGFFF